MSRMIAISVSRLSFHTCTKAKVFEMTRCQKFARERLSEDRTLNHDFKESSKVNETLYPIAMPAYYAQVPCRVRSDRRCKLHVTCHLPDAQLLSVGREKAGSLLVCHSRPSLPGGCLVLPPYNASRFNRVSHCYQAALLQHGQHDRTRCRRLERAL